MKIALVGMPGSGKGEASKVIEENGFHIFYMHDAVFEEVEKRGLERNQKNVGMVANELREREGAGAVAKRMAWKIGSERQVCIEGVRSKAEIDVFRKVYDDIVVIGVDAPPEVRFERMKERGRLDDIKSYEEFLEKEKREAGWGIGEAIEAADHKIVNDGALPELREKVGALLERLLKRSGI